MRKQLVLLSLLALTLDNPAFAYIDPGAGAYVVQSLIALAGAALFYLSHPGEILRKLKEKLRKPKNPS